MVAKAKYELKIKKDEGRMILRRYRWLSVERLAADTAASTSRGRAVNDHG